jgi:hypothetical protein
MGTNIVIGYGEIGKAVGQVLGEHSWLDIDAGPPTGVYEVMHICLPYSENFVEIVKSYVNKYKAEHIIIWATVPIGTTKEIPKAVHSPVEGKHPELATSIRIMPRWIGYNDKVEGNFFAEFFYSLNLNVRRVPGSDFTEALKLLSTTEYGINIEFARYKKHVADSLEMDYDLMKDWNSDYNDLYRDLNMTQYKKYILDAPEGKKGGHCVTPNSLLLHEQYPSDFTRIVGEIE